MFRVEVDKGLSANGRVTHTIRKFWGATDPQVVAEVSGAFDHYDDNPCCLCFDWADVVDRMANHMWMEHGMVMQKWDREEMAKWLKEEMKCSES